MSIEVEGGALLQLLDLINPGRGMRLPSVDAMALAIAAAEFVVKAGDSDAPLTLPELAVVDVARAFLALIEDPTNSDLWDRLEACRVWFEDDNGDV